MKAIVDQETCISCGMCVNTCNEVFEFNEDGKAHAVVDEVPTECEADASMAADGCPVDAISIEEN